MSFLNKFNTLFLIWIFVLTTLPVAVSVAGTRVTFKTKVVVGTCEFDDGNDFNKTISLTKNNYLMVSNVEKSEIKVPVVTDTFSYTVKCKNFPENSIKNIKIKAVPAMNTLAENGIYYSNDDITNTGFILKACDANNENCQDSENNEGIASFATVSDDLITVNYYVSLVKRKPNVTPGISTASVSLIYLQD